MIDLQFVEKLIDLLNSSSAVTIEVRKNFWSTTVRVSKAGFDNAGPVTYQVTAGASGQPAAASAARTSAAEAAEAAAKPAAQLLEIKSPMVGTFYAAPEPGAEPYVSTATHIRPGQTLCIIEAMKIMNPIDAEVSGVIREIAVQDAQPVEYGQVLFRVDPNG
jgi:acetyl-CoA carboxylase biotin carboxyl carrier protein